MKDFNNLNNLKLKEVKRVNILVFVIYIMCSFKTIFYYMLCMYPRRGKLYLERL